MAVTTFSELPPAIALGGDEIICLSVPQFGPTGEVVSFVTMTATSAEIAALAFGGPSVLSPTMRQLIAALASINLHTTLFNALPADRDNAYNIAYWHAHLIPITDPFIVGFLQPTLGFDLLETEALYILALTFPI